jgi:hypothetical protein
MRSSYWPAALFLAIAVLPANASSIAFTFSSPTGVLNPSQTYTQSGVSITAYGFNGTANNNTNTPTNLFGKQAGGDENGLGLANSDADHEIQTTNFIQVDFDYVQTVFHATTAQFQMGSVGPAQPGEGWEVYGSNTLGNIGTLVAQGTDENLNMIPGFASYRYFAFTGWNANGQTPGADGILNELVVNRSATAITPRLLSSSAPEPFSLILAGSGLIGLALLSRRNKM